MAVALTPDAFLSRTTSTAWDVYFSWCGWRRIDVDRNQFTILTYLGNVAIGGGFQFTVDSDLQLIVFDCNDFSDLLAGAGPTLGVGEWWFLGITTVAADEPNNVVLYWAQEGDASLNSATVSYAGPYDYTWHGVGARPGADGSGGAFRLHGSAWGDRTWQNTTLTPSEMLAEFQSATPVKTTGLWSSWPMETAATATTDASGNSRPLTATAGTGTITDTDSPSFGTDGTATPDAIAVATTVPQASVTAGATVSASAVAAAASVPAASATGAGLASPAAIASTATTPAASVSAASGVAAIAATATLPAPGVSAATSPATVDATTTLPSATATGGGSATVTPDPITVAVTVLAVAASAGVGPSAVLATTALPAPTVTGGTGATAAPDPIAAAASLPAALVSAGATVTPAVVLLAALLPQATATGGTPTPDVDNAGTYREPVPGNYRERLVNAWREP